MAFSLDECIEKLLTKQLLVEALIKEICEKTKELLMRESNVVHISAPVTVVGDIHGWDRASFFSLWPAGINRKSDTIMFGLITLEPIWILQETLTTVVLHFIDGASIRFIKTVLRPDRNFSDRRILSGYKLFIFGRLRGSRTIQCRNDLPINVSEASVPRPSSTDQRKSWV